ncbi:MAG: alpha/beta fold hydrolase [Chlorobiaceae bacterium]|nr:alpha/beta fold hydrolase [Chlorobiaceae bacterium]
MTNITTPPAWLDRQAYPFESRFFPTSAGRMHYVDEGSGEPIVFVHGNPVWSYVYRDLIRELRGSYRCIAPDHIGFGLSDKPADWSYLPEDHARNLELLLESLDLHQATIVVNDWGGPIGLSYALDHPERVSGIVVSNTWLWSVASDWYYQAFSWFMGGPIGRWLTGEFNFFVRTFMPVVYGEKSKLTPKVHGQYIHPFDERGSRKGMWVFPGRIIGSSGWLDSLWSRIVVLRGKKVLLAWGMLDIAFRENELNTWTRAFPDAAILRFEDAGHYVAEEKPLELAAAIRRFISGKG